MPVQVGRESLSDGVKIISSKNEQFPVTLEMQDGNVKHLSDQCVQTLLFPDQEYVNIAVHINANLMSPKWQPKQQPSGRPCLYLYAILAVRDVSDCYVLRFCSPPVRLFVCHLANAEDAIRMSGIAARILLTAWSAYSIWRTKHLEQFYDALLRAPGTPCSMDFFPTYFASRSRLEVSVFLRNILIPVILIDTGLGFELYRTADHDLDVASRVFGSVLQVCWCSGAHYSYA